MERHRYSWMIMPVLLLAGCAAKPSLRPPALDPTSTRSSESPVPPPLTINAPDPLLTIAAEPLADPDRSGMHHDMHHGMSGMRHGEHDQTAEPPASPRSPVQPAAGLTCVMHPEVHADTRGNCPKCGMHLVPEPKKSGGHP